LLVEGHGRGAVKPIGDHSSIPGRERLTAAVSQPRDSPTLGRLVVWHRTLTLERSRLATRARAFQG
jgi:hypothetical protein